MVVVAKVMMAKNMVKGTTFSSTLHMNIVWSVVTISIIVGQCYIFHIF